jgi:hypothetical protein
MNEKGETHKDGTESCINLLPARQRGASAGLFIVGDQGSYYNTLNALTTYPANKIHGQEVI